jgi:EmrB/QacA subfamily drug resistance transporter
MPREPVERALRRGQVLIGCMLSLGLVAMDSTIVATAIPSIVKDLGSFSLFPWIFSSYLLMQAVSMPVFGKLTDMISRRAVLIIGTAIFLGGSILCGVSSGMAMLVICRGIQGIGAGAVQPVTQTIVGDLYELRERGKTQGLMSSVWAVSAVIGPALGGLFAQYIGWRWIFYINLPIGAAALAIIMIHLRVTRPPGSRAEQLDVLGVILLAMGVGSVVVGFLQSGSHRLALGTPYSYAILAVGITILAAFALHQRRARNPILPPWLMRTRSLAWPIVHSITVGLLVIAVTTYIPTFCQRTIGVGAVLAGFALASMSIGWPFASAFSARMYMRIGFRNTALVGGTCTLGACILFILLSAHANVWQVTGCSVIFGVGLGFQVTPLLVGIQSVVGFDRRGQVTGAFVFTRTVGSAVGTGIFAAVAHSASLANTPHGVYLETHRVMLAMMLAALAGLAVLALTPRVLSSAEAAYYTRRASEPSLTANEEVDDLRGPRQRNKISGVGNLRRLRRGRPAS